MLIMAIAGAIVALFWLFRRKGGVQGGDRDLMGCIGIAEGRMEPGAVGRVRITDKSGNVVILPARLDESLPFEVERGTEIVVIENAKGDGPAVVSPAELPGSGPH